MICGVTTGRAPAQMVWRRFCRHNLAVSSALALIILAIAALLAPVFEMGMGLDATAADLFNRFQAPSATHPLAPTSWEEICSSASWREGACRFSLG